MADCWLVYFSGGFSLSVSVRNFMKSPLTVERKSSGFSVKSPPNFVIHHSHTQIHMY